MTAPNKLPTTFTPLRSAPATPVLSSVEGTAAVTLTVTLNTVQFVTLALSARPSERG